MLRHYFIQFARSLRRQKLFSFINLLGLTVGIVCTLLIYLYVRHELSYDSFHHHAERIYRVNQTFIWGENSENQFASTGPGVAYAMNAEVPEVELITSIHTPGNFIVSYTSPGQEVIAFEEEKILAADTSFFTMFNFPLLRGDATSVLQHANTLVMTESTAQKYFGDENPVGKLVHLGGLNGEGRETYEVTGVVKDLPNNSYIEFDMLLSMKGFPIERLYWSWIWTQLETYVRLQEGTDIEAVRARLKDIPRKHAEETLRRIMNTTFDDYINSGKKWELFLQPLTMIHLPTETVYNRLNDSGNIKIIYSLMGTAAVIVLLACVNFMNLSTAQFTRRIREASMRKILGLSKKELCISYFIEALIFCLTALLAAAAVTEMMLPSFNLLTGKVLDFQLFGDHTLLASAFALVLLMALISSSYPAWFLSSFNPAEAIKGKIKTAREGKSFRNSLVVFQFAVSIFLMISTVVVFQQLTYFSEKDLGFDKDNLLVLKHVEGIRNDESIRNESLEIPGVVSASRCTSLPPHIFGGDKFTAETMNGNTFSLNFTSADENYIPTLDIHLKFGRNFSTESGSAIYQVIVNESTVKKIGWPLDESVIGRHLKYPNGDDANFEVIGVVSDFNYWSLQTPIEPLAIFHIANDKVAVGDRRYLALRIKGESNAMWQSMLAQLNGLWRQHAGGTPFEYTFVDEVFAETFKTQQQFGQVLTVLAVLALVIASLGLLGMIVYALEQRMKEIGIRKISGASARSILVLISKGYAKLIILAFFVASPFAYWLMQMWLREFAYRITPSLLVFVGVGAGTLMMGVLITGFHAMKAARMNPVDILRDE